MTKEELHETLSENIKKYRKGKFTQEELAEAVGVSTQNINDIEGKRRWPRESTLVKIAEVLDVEVYQLFLTNNFDIKIEDTDENSKIRIILQKQLITELRKSVNKTLDKMESAKFIE